jgi:hypothetical protein
MAAIATAREILWPHDHPSKRKRGIPKIKPVAPPTAYNSDEFVIAEQAPAGYFQDFKTLAEKVAVPLFEADESDRPLVPNPSSFRGKPIYWFDRDGVIWEMNADTWLHPVLTAFLWMNEHDGKDPFLVKDGAGKRKTLELRPELNWTGPKHLYIYETVNPIPSKWSAPHD